MKLLERVHFFMKRFQMVFPGEKVLLGVSGGPDSVALLHMLRELREKMRFTLCVAHLNHGLRGADADADAAFVEDLVKDYGLSYIVEKRDVESYRRGKSLSIQEAARQMRYCFLDEAAGRLGAQKVALGHHANDQAETVLFNLLRGAGSSGLKGMLPVRQDKYIRPLLEITRPEIEEYCREHSLPVRQDCSNLKKVYTRNRIRLELLPYLERDYNKQIVTSLVRMADILRDEDSYLEDAAGKAFVRLCKRIAENRFNFITDDFNVQPTAIRRRLVRRAWSELSGSPYGLSFQHVEDVLGLAAGSPSGTELELPFSVRAVKGYKYFYLARGRKSGRVPFYCRKMVIPGSTYIPEIDLTLWSEIIEEAKTFELRQLPGNEAVISYERLTEPLKIRRRREGDRFIPLGMEKEIKLKNFLIDQKIPRDERDYIPLVVCGKDIVWVGGVRLGELWKVGPGTGKCLHLKLYHGFSRSVAEVDW